MKSFDSNCSLAKDQNEAYEMNAAQMTGSNNMKNLEHSLSKMSIEPDQVYGMHEINLDGVDVKDCETHTLS